MNPQFIKYLKLYLLPILLGIISEYASAQNPESNHYIPQTTYDRSGGSSTVIWNPDGSVTVKNGEVMFQSGIKKFQIETSKMERESEMLMLDENFISQGEK